MASRRIEDADNFNHLVNGKGKDEEESLEPTVAGPAMVTPGDVTI